MDVGESVVEEAEGDSVVPIVGVADEEVVVDITCMEGSSEGIAVVASVEDGTDVGASLVRVDEIEVMTSVG